MDVGNCNQWAPKDVYTARDILAEIEELHALEPLDANYSGEVASRYRYQDGSGEFGHPSFLNLCETAIALGSLLMESYIPVCLQKRNSLKPILRNRGCVQDRLQKSGPQRRPLFRTSWLGIK